MNKDLFIFEKAFSYAYDENWPFSQPGQDYFTKRLTHENSIFYIAERDEKIIGYILAYVDNHAVRTVNPICVIENTYVKEGFRGNGVGNLLIEKVKSECKERSAKVLRVQTYTDNKSAMNFYQKHGLKPLLTTLESVL